MESLRLSCAKRAYVAFLTCLLDSTCHAGRCNMTNYQARADPDTADDLTGETALMEATVDVLNYLA